MLDAKAEETVAVAGGDRLVADERNRLFDV